MLKEKELVELLVRNVPKAVRKRLKIVAAEEGKSMQGLVLELIKKHIKEW